ncbi:RusA family crossover junction endodeoxyribonuclease [Nonomuraea sp. NPDC050786]|uniref:RusA family crossover junction endodeoxyribonuclease n=1 Tax=Nonomuraea sp. NPDC050786 TaxID=3154840 RepID=UPI0033C0056D
MVAFLVQGDVTAQGSKNAFAIYRGSAKKGTREFTGRIAVVETAKKRLDPWREIIKAGARESMGRYVPWEEFPITGPVRVSLTFSLRAPKRIPPERLGWPATKPDVDKYVRGALDALTMAAVWRDDGQVVRHTATKVYDLLPSPGVVVEVHRLDAESAQAAKEVVMAQEFVRAALQAH